MERFLPGLEVFVAHRQFMNGTALPTTRFSKLGEYNLISTTYAMVDRLGWIRKQTWDLVILDEAGAIKNSYTRQTKAIKQLSSKARFKQLCSHPDHYLGQKGFREEESGKFCELRRICETVAEKRERRAKAKRAEASLRKKLGELNPITIEGGKLGITWWGKAWNKNLESYADFSNRIGRGRSYVRSGAVLDLRIQKGSVQAVVQGSSSEPYQVVVKIEALADTRWRAIVRQAKGRLESMQQLLEGAFPDEMKDLLTARGSGLFPAPREIKLGCSCPDGAVLCKHVAAVLFGVGARLDHHPDLFFELRGVRKEDLIGKVLRQETRRLLGSGTEGSSRVLSTGDAELEALFGISFGAVKPQSKRRGRPKKARVSVAPKGKRGT